MKPATSRDSIPASDGTPAATGLEALSPIPDAASSPLVEVAVQRNQSRNIWNHLLRDVNRVTVLVAADLAVYFGLRELLWGFRLGWVGPRMAEWVVWAFPPGFLGGLRFAVALVGSLAIAGCYGNGDRRRDSSRLLGGTALAALVALYGGFWGPDPLFTLVRAVAATAVFAAGLTATRHLVDRVVWRLRPRGVARALVVTHADANQLNLARLIRRVRDFQVVSTVALDGTDTDSVHPRLRTLGEDIDACRAEILLLWGELSDEEFAYAIDVALSTGCRVLAANRTFGGLEPRGLWLGGRQLLELTPPSLRGWQLALKRAVDLVGAVTGLVLLAPLLLLLAIIVRLESPGPAIFAQRRVGPRGRLFWCFKFRSMRQDAERLLRANPQLYAQYLANHFKLPEATDPRLTRVGRFLRKASLDELPQLVNVLLGQMSLVGPRPIVPAELEHYGHDAALVFMSLKPGMTGAWAVNGRSEVGYPDRAQLELEYIRRWSLWSDLGILARTFPAVVRRTGAH